MNKYWKAVGIGVLAAGALYYPALKLYQYLTKRMAEGAAHEEADDHHIKAFAPAYRGKQKHPHHRAPHNGQSNPGMA
jgi:hypothetical protein